MEETIGEKDRLALKEIFGRGQNYPIIETKLNSVKSLLKKFNLELIYAEYSTYQKIYSSIESLIDSLNRAPIIPDFDEKKDAKFLEQVKQKLFINDSISLENHRFYWVAKKL